MPRNPLVKQMMNSRDSGNCCSASSSRGGAPASSAKSYKLRLT